MAIKRCKNCRLWRPYQGDEPTMPKTKSHACMLRLIDKDTDVEGEKVTVPTMRDDKDTRPGPHYHKRTHPSFTCGYFVAKHSPRVNKKNEHVVLAPQTVNLIDERPVLSDDLVSETNEVVLSDAG